MREGTGVRVKNPTKHLVCGKTAKTYMFWDNLMYHYKNLAPLYGKKIEFKVSIYSSIYLSISNNLSGTT